MLDSFASIFKLDKFCGLKSENAEKCTLELTVVTGLEEVAAQEIRENLSVDPVIYRGRVIIDIAVDKVKETLKLRSVDHVFIMVHVEPNFILTDERDNCFSKLYQYSTKPDWKKGLAVWQNIFKYDVGDPFEGVKTLENIICKPKPELDLRLMKKESPVAINLPEHVRNSITSQNLEKENSSELKIPVPEQSHYGPRFRVSCHRVGSSHKFGSPEAARQFGAGVNDRFGWPVDLSNFDLEIHLHITDDFVYVSISLTKDALFKRNISVFGPTNLRSTICYNMISLAKPQTGDIIIDPMCGGCTIPMEGSLTFNKSFYMAGDNVSHAVNRSQANIANLNIPLKIDVLQWNCTRLPLRNEVADVIISYLSFGKRMGSKGDNRVLYFKSLVEMARVTKLGTGRAVLLTHDRNSMIMNLSRVSKLWKHFSCRSINIGGLAASIYLLRRTLLASDPNILSDVSKRKNKKRKFEQSS